MTRTQALIVLFCCCAIATTQCAAATTGDAPPPDSMPSQSRSWFVPHQLLEARSYWRGSLDALRDFLFPEKRKVNSGPISEREAALEGGAELAAVRRWMHAHALAASDDSGLTALYETHPTPVRYALAIILGLLLLGAMNLVQFAAGACARASMKLVFKLTGDASHLDEADWEAREASLRAAAAAVASKGKAPSVEQKKRN